MLACYFCQRNIKEIDFRSAEVLKRFLSPSQKIKPREKTGVCAFHQRKLAKAIKRARQMGLLPYLAK